MNQKPLFQYIFDMLDYADALLALAKSEQDARDEDNYFMSLLYIEDMLDKYGRAQVSTSEDAAGQDSHKLMVEATRRMDLLRQAIFELAKTRDFDDILRSRTEHMNRDWSGIYKKHFGTQST